MTARQGLTVVGQVVGAYFGPIGSAIGGQIGGFIGGEIDGPQKGPRLDDTRAPAVEFGAKCPRPYGRVWLTLSPLWWSKLRESSVNTGGKGAADETTDQFVYHCDMLGRLGDGANVIAWTRIRIDGKIEGTQLASSSAESLDATANSERWGDIELRSGGPTQTPWSVMEAVEGTGNVSAYRDQCTLAITNLLMPNGRNPSLIEVEVITKGSSEEQPQDGLLCHFDEMDGTEVLSAIGPNFTPENGADLSGSASQFGGFSGRLTTPSADRFHASGVTGTVNSRAWVAEGFFKPNSLSTGLLFELRSTATGMHVGVYTSASFTAMGFNITSLLYTGSGGFGDPERQLNTAIFNHVVIQWDGSRLACLANGALIAEFGGGGGDYFGPIEFDRVTISDGTYPLTGNVDEFYFHFIDDLTDSVYADTYAIPTEPFDVQRLAPVWTPEPEDLQDVLEAEMLRCAPLTIDHLDMSAAAGKEVWGFKASRSAAAECGVLLDWYYLDIFCGSKITVVERGGAVEQTIPYGYTGSGVDGTSDPFAGLIRGADVESQFSTSVQYINILADGEVDTQQGQRVGTGSEVRAVNFSIYSKPTLAKGRADTITHDTRVAAHTATLRLGVRQAARMQPASVQTLVDNKGNSYRTRALRLVWNRGVYEVDVCLDDPNILKTVGITAEVDTSVIEVTPPAQAEFLPLDIPRVSDAQNASGYLALVKTDDTSGSRWFDSPDDVTYAARFDFANDAVFGVVTAATGIFGRGVLFDEGSSLTVDVGDGALASATRAALLANRGVNLFAIGIAGRMVLGQFRTATLVGAGVYTLGGFVNMGANGTEQYCSSIITGDDFAMLGISGTAQIARDTSDLGVPFSVKAVAFGASLDNVTAVDFTANGVNLKPLSPVLLRAERDGSSGDIEISWTRRTRMGTRFGGPLGDSCPLGEASEQYRVRLYTSGSYATLLRDLGSSTSSTITYTAAQRATDGHSLYTPFYVAVTMVSDVVGEGYPLQDAA